VGFEDHFSFQADQYRRYRPTYPQAQFAFLATLVPRFELAWDCGTGNGQVAHALADDFERVLRPEGVLAASCNSLPRITAGVDAQVDRLFTELLAEYWPPERAHVEAKYQTIPFPFRELDTPVFTGETAWNCSELIGYLGSWSATVRYRQLRGVDPIAKFREDLTRSWGDPAETKRVHWPIHLRAGRV
jgi:hypothetical protein